MTTEVDLCNRAIALAGSSEFIAQSLNEQGQGPTLCKLFYASVRDGLLRKGTYGFSRFTVSLGLLSAATPPQPWLYGYAFPQDNLKVLFLTKQDLPPPASVPLFTTPGTPVPIPMPLPSEKYELQALQDQSQTVLYCNINPAYLTYVRQITNVNLFDLAFQQNLELVLASKICYALTQKASRAQTLVNQANLIMAEAEAETANEQDDNLGDYIPEHILER